MDPSLLEILVCPITHSKLHQEGDFLVSAVGSLKYPIKDGLPVLLPDAAILPPRATMEALKAMRNNRAE